MSRSLSRLGHTIRRELDSSFFTSRLRLTAHLASLQLNPIAQRLAPIRPLSTSRRIESAFSDASIYADDGPPPVSVKTVSSSEIELLDGLVLPSACIFLEGRVFLWELPKLDTHASWPGWNNDHFKLFEVVVPRPEILLLGTGDHAVMPPPHVKKYLNDLGIQLDVMNSWNASSTYNMLSEEGRRVACAIIPQTHRSWHALASASS